MNSTFYSLISEDSFPEKSTQTPFFFLRGLENKQIELAHSIIRDSNDDCLELGITFLMKITSTVEPHALQSMYNWLITQGIFEPRILFQKEFILLARNILKEFEERQANEETLLEETEKNKELLNLTEMEISQNRRSSSEYPAVDTEDDSYENVSHHEFNPPEIQLSKSLSTNSSLDEENPSEEGKKHKSKRHKSTEDYDHCELCALEKRSTSSLEVITEETSPKKKSKGKSSSTEFLLSPAVLSKKRIKSKSRSSRSSTDNFDASCELCVEERKKSITSSEGRRNL